VPPCPAREIASTPLKAIAVHETATPRFGITDPAAFATVYPLFARLVAIAQALLAAFGALLARFLMLCAALLADLIPASVAILHLLAALVQLTRLQVLPLPALLYAQLLAPGTIELPVSQLLALAGLQFAQLIAVAIALFDALLPPLAGLLAVDIVASARTLGARPAIASAFSAPVSTAKLLTIAAATTELRAVATATAAEFGTSTTAAAEVLAPSAAAVGLSAVTTSAAAIGLAATSATTIGFATTTTAAFAVAILCGKIGDGSGVVDGPLRPLQRLCRGRIRRKTDEPCESQ
jgi:hypothetical protein